MKCIVHIGPGRTGTTSIQLFLRRNRERLLADGVFVPRTRKPSHREFLLLLRDRVGKGRAQIKWDVHSEEDLQERQQLILPDLQRQLREARQSHRVAIISSEGLAWRPRKKIEEFRKVLAPYADEFLIIAYLRRQDLIEVSRTKNKVKNFGQSADPFGRKRRMYSTMLDNWAAVFGESHVRPVVFVDSALQKTDHIESFIKACELGNLKLDSYSVPEQRNQSWDARSLQMMQLLNEFVPAIDNRKITPERLALEEVLKRGFPDFVPYRPARAEAEAFYALYREDNELVRRRWFPDAPALFHDDFSMYPISPSEVLTLRDCAFLVAELAKQQAARKNFWQLAGKQVKASIGKMLHSARPAG
jgi:hypothetical protein